MDQKNRNLEPSIKLIETPPEDIVPEESSYRFVILTLYLLVAFVNSLPNQTFSSINVTVSNTFQISPFNVTLNALLFSIAHPLFAYPCNWLLHRYGMRICFLIGGILVSGGVWLRLLIEIDHAVFCLVGSAFAAVGNIFILNTPSKIAFNWFRTEKGSLVIFAGVIATMFSISLGSAIPGLILGQNSTQDEIKNFLLIEAIVITVPYILLVIFFREKPVIPPSKAAMAVSTEKKASYLILMRKLFTNIEYIKLIVSISLSYGSLTAFITIMDQCLKDLGYSNSGQITALIMITSTPIGVLFVPIFSIALKRTKKYKIISSICFIGGTIALLGLQFCFYNTVTIKWAIILIAAIQGIFMTPLPSIMVAYASELTFPIDEGSSAGYLFAFSQTFGFILGIISINVLHGSATIAKILFSVFAGLMVLALIFILFTNEDLKKSQFQTDAQIDQSLGLGTALMKTQSIALMDFNAQEQDS